MNNNQHNLIFIHCSGTQAGNEGSTPLINYLSNELGSEFNIVHPAMPSPRAPSYEAWKKTIDKLDISETSILAGHSLGASVLLKYLAEEKPFRSFGALFLIAAPLWGSPDWTHGDYTLPAGFAGALADIKRIFFYHSTDDEVVPFHHVEAYQASLPRASVRILEGQGHYFTKGIPILVEDMMKVSDLKR
jgi:predicted alpha/beta hydrolase family esterase